MLIDAGGGLSQDVDVVTGLLHVEQEEDWDGGEGEHPKPDEGQDVRHYDELLKQEGYGSVALVFRCHCDECGVIQLAIKHNSRF